jgi:hypothetical protein
MSTSKEPCFDWLQDWVSSMPSVNTAAQKKILFLLGISQPSKSEPVILQIRHGNSMCRWLFG